MQNLKPYQRALMSAGAVLVVVFLVNVIGRAYDTATQPPPVQGFTYDGPFEDGSGRVTVRAGDRNYSFTYCLPRWPCGVETPPKG